MSDPTTEIAATDTSTTTTRPTPAMMPKWHAAINGKPVHPVGLRVYTVRPKVAHTV